MKRRIWSAGAPPSARLARDGRGHRLEEVAQDGAIQGGLVLEVVVEHRLVHAGARGDAVDLGAVEAARGELDRPRRRAGARGTAGRRPGALTNHLVNHATDDASGPTTSRLPSVTVTLTFTAPGEFP